MRVALGLLDTTLFKSSFIDGNSDAPPFPLVRLINDFQMTGVCIYVFINKYSPFNEWLYFHSRKKYEMNQQIIFFTFLYHVHSQMCRN